MSSSKDKRFLKIINAMKKKFEQHKYYEGQQMLKTLYSRLITQNKYDQASKLLSEGALLLMGHKKTSESVAIVSDLIITWKQSLDKSLNTNRAKLLHELFCMIPQNDNQNIKTFMKEVLEWIKYLKKQITDNHNLTRNEQNKLLNQIDVNMMPLYQSYGINLWNLKNYHKASSAFVRTNATSKMVEMFAEWVQQSSSKEKPYYTTRIVLQYLCIGNIKGCRAFIQSVCPRNDLRGPSFRHPLENFCDLLCESIERKSVVLYNVVTKTYQPLLTIDPKLIQLLQRVAHSCLGIPLPRNSGGLIGNLLSMLG